MVESTVTTEDLAKARRCLDCPVCSRARRKQRGLCYWFVKHLERGKCHNCNALEKVMGVKAYEPLPDDWEARMEPHEPEAGA